MRAKSREIGLRISFPIFSGGDTTSRVREAVALRGKTQAELDDARRASEGNSRESYQQVITGLAQIKAFQTAVASSQKAVEANVAGVKLGTKLTIDWLNSRETLFQANVELVIIKHRVLVALLKLKGSVGELGAPDFQAFGIHLTPGSIKSH